MVKTIMINVIEKRLQNQFGITFYMQGGGVIRSMWSPSFKLNILSQKHSSFKNCKQAIASEAYRVLVDSETVANRWLEFLPG
jgi:hypothetical protein